MLYQEAVRRMARVEEAPRSDPCWVTDLHHVRAIFVELRGALDHESAPEYCGRLDPLYGWCITELVVASRERDAARVVPVREITETLLTGWTAMMQQPRRQSA
jgi:flagellin-specific chaperone FliS